MTVAQVVGSVPVEQVRHAAEVKEHERRAEVRRRLRRIQRMNAEAERRAQGWEPGFHNRIRGLRSS